jgi:hypothetical protein
MPKHSAHALTATLALGAALLGLSPVMAQMQDLPPRRAGQWESRMVTEKPAGGPTIVSQMCIDAATDREMLEFGLKASKNNCTRFDMRKAGAAWVIDAECAFGPVKNVTRTTITGDFQSSITFRIEGTAEGIPGAGSGPQPTLMTQTAIWKGPCTDGMKPGDISLGNGLKMNIKQMQKLQKMLPNVQIR